MNVLDTIFYLFCHQLPDRSLHFETNIFPVCHRCAGIYLGIFASYISVLLTKKNPALPKSKSGIIYLSLLFTPLMIDGWGNKLELWNSSEIVRMISGVWAGVFLAAVLIPFIKTEKTNGMTKEFSSIPVLISFGVGLLLTFLLHSYLNNFIFYFSAYAAAAGMIYFLMNLCLLLMNFKLKDI